MHKPLLLALTLLLPAAAHANEYDTLIKARKFAEADRAVAARLAQDPRDADALVARTDLALTHAQDAKNEEAVQAARACVAAHPQHSKCHEALGDAVVTKALAGSMIAALGMAGDVRKAYQQAVALDPRNVEARMKLLQFYVQAPSVAGGSKDKARALVEDTAKAHPAAGKLLRAMLQGTGDDYAQAEALALSVEPGADETLQLVQRNALSIVASHYMKDKKYGESERIYALLQKRYPAHGTGWFGLGRVAQVQEKWREALGHFQKSVAVEPRAMAYYRMGQCWDELQDRQKSIAAFEQSLTIRPALGKKQRGEVLDKLKDLKG